MIILLGEENHSNSIDHFKCEGCRDYLTIVIDWMHGFNCEDAKNLAQDIGWRRRLFTEAVHPWFCSEDCAYNSHNAKYWEKIWNTK